MADVYVMPEELADSVCRVAAEAERAKVVAWLRKRADASGDVPYRICNNVADAIEALAHHEAE